MPKILISGKNNIQFYVDAIEYCGAETDSGYLIKGKSADYDGLVLCGGSDTDPKYYGEEINGAVNIDIARDESEFALAEDFIKAGKPVLGICRGCQLLNIYFGGNMIQHIDTVNDHKRDGFTVHEVVAIGDGVASHLYGSEFSVNSLHHQAMKRIGDGLRVTLKSKKDGIPEAIEHESLPVLGFQFHPERMCLSQRSDDTIDGIEIFKYFLKMCKSN